MTVSEDDSDQTRLVSYNPGSMVDGPTSYQIAQMRDALNAVESAVDRAFIDFNIGGATPSKDFWNDVVGWTWSVITENNYGNLKVHSDGHSVTVSSSECEVSASGGPRNVEIQGRDLSNGDTLSVRMNFIVQDPHMYRTMVSSRINNGRWSDWTPWFGRPAAGLYWGGEKGNP